MSSKWVVYWGLALLGLKDARVGVVWHLKAPLKIQHGRMLARKVALCCAAAVYRDCRGVASF